MLKSHSCGVLRKEHAGTTVTLAGWVNRRRDHGGLVFIDLRDHSGIVQTVFNPEVSDSVLKTAENMRSEYVVRLTGTVAARPEGTINENLPTGEIEIIVSDAEILNTSLTPPFYINEEVDVDETLRLKYRYLDLRRQRMQRNLLVRHQIVKFMRKFLDDRGFMEIETPMLTKSTPEGARDYLVPSRLHHGQFYALPQSPQQLKQLLMVGGLEKYYQIARCFRDEDTRADRQPEFTQLDIEMSFAEQEDILNLLEEMFTLMTAEVAPGKKMITPFPRLTYAESMDRFGSDKPDLRFGMEIGDLSDIVKDSGFGVFSKAVAGGGTVRGICVPGAADYSRKQLDQLNDIARKMGSGGIVTISLTGSGGLEGLNAETVKSNAARYLTIEEMKDMAERLGASMGDLLLVTAGEYRQVVSVLGEIRKEMGHRLKMADPDMLGFGFILDFPLFDKDPATGKLDSVHHPFTMPKEEDIPLLETKPEKALSQAYDFICNGSELSSGSIRIHTAEMQKKIFKLLGHTDESIQEMFGHMLEAFSYGAPPHGGIAPGIERVVMLLTGEENIRDVVAFPKTQSAQDLMFGSPSHVSEQQLADLHIGIIEEED